MILILAAISLKGQVMYENKMMQGFGNVAKEKGVSKDSVYKFLNPSLFSNSDSLLENLYSYKESLYILDVYFNEGLCYYDDLPANWGEAKPYIFRSFTGKSNWEKHIDFINQLDLSRLVHIEKLSLSYPSVELINKAGSLFKIKEMHLKLRNPKDLKKINWALFKDLEILTLSAHRKQDPDSLCGAVYDFEKATIPKEIFGLTKLKDLQINFPVNKIEKPKLKRELDVLRLEMFADSKVPSWLIEPVSKYIEVRSDGCLNFKNLEKVNAETVFLKIQNKTYPNFIFQSDSIKYLYLLDVQMNEVNKNVYVSKNSKLEFIKLRYDILNFNVDSIYIPKQIGELPNIEVLIFEYPKIPVKPVVELDFLTELSHTVNVLSLRNLNFASSIELLAEHQSKVGFLHFRYFYFSKKELLSFNVLNNIQWSFLERKEEIQNVRRNFDYTKWTKKNNYQFFEGPGIKQYQRIY